MVARKSRLVNSSDGDSERTGEAVMRAAPGHARGSRDEACQADRAGSVNRGTAPVADTPHACGGGPGRLGRGVGLLSWRVVVAFLASVIVVAGAWALAAEGGVLDLWLTGLICQWAEAPRNAGFVSWLEWFSQPYGGQLPTVVLIAGSGGFWLFCLWRCCRCSLSPVFRVARKKAEVVLLAALLVAFLCPLLKGTFARERPRFHKDNVHYTPWYDVVSRHRRNPFRRGSFPSGHTMQASLIFVIIHWVGRAGAGRLQGLALKGLVSVPCFMYVALMGFSRIVLAKHWVGDVYFAILIGFAIVSFSAWVVKPQNVESPRVRNGTV